MSELHITSFVIRARPADAPGLARLLAERLGVEIHAVADGKIVATLESPSEQHVTDALDAMQRLDGVMAANLVFHHAEPAQEPKDTRP